MENTIDGGGQGQNHTLTCNNGQVSYYGSDSSWIPWDWHTYYPIYYPQYVTTSVIHEDRVSKALRVITKLMETKVIKEISVPEFIKMLNDIAEIL